jgi:hypothetical protein
MESADGLLSHSTKSESPCPGRLCTKYIELRRKDRRLAFGLQHVLDQLVGQFFGADMIGSVGDCLLQLSDL